MHLYPEIALPRTRAVIYADHHETASIGRRRIAQRIARRIARPSGDRRGSRQDPGLTPDAVRSRLRRGTLKRNPERGKEGEVLVVMPVPKNAGQSRDQSWTVDDRSIDLSGDQSSTDRPTDPTVALIERMASEIDHLRSELTLERESSSELRRIIAAMTQRISVVEIEAPPDEPGGRLAASEKSGRGSSDREEDRRPQRASWWRRFFGFDE